MGKAARAGRRVRTLVRADLRNGVQLLLLVVLVGVGLPLLLLAVLTSPVRSALARRHAQAAADRLFPGEVRVLRARGMGEAGGYAIDARLIADPGRDLGWGSDRRCPPGSRGEVSLRAAVATARDHDAEGVALVRALTAAGLTPAADSTVDHAPDEVSAGDAGSVRGAATVVVAPEALDDAVGLTNRIDAAALAWTTERSDLLPERDHALRLTLVGSDGRPRARTHVASPSGYRSCWSPPVPPVPPVEHATVLLAADTDGDRAGDLRLHRH